MLKISNNPKVYISRRALKHFVERRKQEMRTKDSEVVLKKLYFIIQNCEHVFQKYDSLLEEECKNIYSKLFLNELNASIRIITESKNLLEQIKSIHIQKHKKL